VRPLGPALEIVSEYSLRIAIDAFSHEPKSMPLFRTTPKRTAVIEDVDAFMAWLATAPIIVSASNKNANPNQPAKDAAAKPASGADADFLAALKSMA
jgi:uncharacterized NAD-dependent epimerase/dehydratase family protein